MAKFTIKANSLNDVKFYLDDQPVEFVKSINLSMTAGEVPKVIMEIDCTAGVDVELPDVEFIHYVNKTADINAKLPEENSLGDISFCKALNGIGEDSARALEKFIKALKQEFTKKP